MNESSDDKKTDAKEDLVYNAPLIPVVRRPKGAQFYFGTWSGRIFLVNTAIFIWMLARGVNAMAPTIDQLVQFGAKDPVKIASGEWWRFFSPMFVHGGLLHLVFNMMGIFAIGYQLERFLGSVWFLLIYVVAGLFGNISSSVFNLHVSVGASGALFGLLGSGFVLESLIGQKIKATTGRRPRQKAYAGMVFVNVILGIMIPMIDNAAHMGGLVAGAAMTYVMLHLRSNQLAKMQTWRAWTVIAALTVASAIGTAMATSPKIVTARLEKAGDKAGSGAEAYFSYSQALLLEPANGDLLIKRGRLLILAGEYAEGLEDLSKAASSGNNHPALQRLAEELKSNGYTLQAEQILELIRHFDVIKI